MPLRYPNRNEELSPIVTKNKNTYTIGDFNIELGNGQEDTWENLGDFSFIERKEGLMVLDFLSNNHLFAMNSLK